MSNDFNPSDDEIATIESFVISFNMEFVVTTHIDKSLVIWEIDFKDKKLKLVKIDKGEVLLHESKDLLELSNDKLLIYSCENNQYIRDLKSSKFSPITPYNAAPSSSAANYIDDKKKLLSPGEKKYLRFLENDDLLLLSIPSLQKEHSKEGKKRTEHYLNGEHLFDWLYKEKKRLPLLFLQSLPLTPSINVYSKDSLKNSKKSSNSYKIPTIGHLDLILINVSRTRIDKKNKKNEQIFFAIDGVILQLNTNAKKMKFERYYIIRNIKKEQLRDSKNCSWMGAVNEEGNLLAICSTYKGDIHTYVFSMKNGILISSRVDKSCDKSCENEYKKKHKKPRIQFLNINNTDILMLSHTCLGDKIEYTIMMPYKLSFAFKEEFCNQKSIKDYMIVERENSTSSQLLLMIATGNQIELIEFKIPIEKLYDQMKQDHNLFIYSSYNVIKNGINNSRIPNEKYRCVGKSLIWELQQRQDSLSLKVCKMDQRQNKETICFHFEEDCNIRFTHLQTLSNDDVVLYGSLDEETNNDKNSSIYIFSLNESTNKIFPRYFYPNTDEFLKRKTLPNPSLKSVVVSQSSKIDMINELLSSRKYLVEMSEEIIDDATKGNKYGRKKIIKLMACLDKLYTATDAEDATEPKIDIHICDLITKFLPKLYLILPTYYTKFISATALFPTPFINETYLSNEFQLVGYTYQAHTLQVYNCIESYVVQRIMLISRVFLKCIHYIFKKDRPRKRIIRFVVPYLGFTKYPTEYSFWKELIRPSDNPFVTFDEETIYDGWNAEALLNFKWNTFGRFYFYIIWGSFSIFLLSFGLGSTLSSSNISNDTRHILLYTSITLGFFFFVHEIRQFIWNLKRYMKDIWNLFDLCAIIFPICTAFFWLYDEKTPSPALISISNLFLYFKFITYLRALDYFGSNLTIIVGVAKRILSFFLILLIIIIGFAHAFFIILTPNNSYDLDVPDQDDDPNNPWNLVTEYHSVSPNGEINPKTTFIQRPDSNSNLFSTYPTSLLAMYLFLTGDSSSLGSWSYQENPFMTILLVMFSFLIVVYLMNLFIGLLNLEIEGNRTHFLFILQKAKIVAEIELFLLLPNQRRWRHWFPDIIVYQMPIGEVQQRIMDIDNNTVSYPSTYISAKLRKLAEMEEFKDGSMSKTECEGLITKLKDEIRNLLNLDKNSGEVENL
ncbi:20406_t:CDS:2 [Funneliformis geosporum]|nr:20406_t:CDS:2 [Funneliformis geosporum]